MKDSTADTLEHKRQVTNKLMQFATELLRRASVHDDSKLEEPEKSAFDNADALSGIEYGSEEYKKQLDLLGPALEHHYKFNSHHPEHYPEGIRDFDLFDLTEALLDWWAATERNKGGSILFSIDYNRKKFRFSDDIAQIMKNTIERWKP